MALNPQKILQGNIGINESMARFHNKAHFWGRLTLLMTILASISAPLYMSFIVGAHPGWGPIIAGLIGYAGFIGVMWVIEPITYYPILGIAGTYLAFLSGNIANLCLPCSAAAQEAIGAENGSNKGEIAGVFGIAAACLVNTIVIVFVILGGSYIIMMLPDVVKSAFNFILPAIFGAVLGQFAFKTPLYGLIGSMIGLAVLLSPIIGFIKIALCVAITITLILYIEKLKSEKGAS
ncbi:small-conductance mechanosensitive channel [Bacillus norwichensis]|uniref:Small-conductance mechanosensitive channel n=1 Tax=Bacillus norwichensis TaxID=2762217 RepID=A0ABR8VK71_9BACI|nr:small-conductance mechanosensitive channel [Bacillus norwichensis]MBD8005153.1 small-conductance mechanosensitive channel [Bacillus norwichensis]